MELNRRDFMKVSGAALLGAAAPPLPAALSVRPIRRVGQLNFNERDPAELDVEGWADYFASAPVDAVLLSVTGIIAFYPTDVPFHRRSRYLNGRDLFGECVTAAKRRGLQIIGRTSPDLNWQDAVEAHPEWFMRHADGSVQVHSEDPRLFRTCMFSAYYTDYMPAVMREVNARYDVDGLYTNGWPTWGELPVCHCAICRKLPPPGTIDYWHAYNDRVEFLWNQFAAIAREKRPGNLFFANLGGGLRACPNLNRVRRYCSWFNADNQGRGGEGAPLWGAAQQGRIAKAVMKSGVVAHLTGAWSTCGTVRWRNAAKSRAEAEMWMGQTLASGAIIYYHWLGGQKGLGEDRRWMATGHRYLQWQARHQRHFENRRSLARIAVVMGQRTHLFHTPPGEGRMQEFLDGLYYVLVEGRFFFDFIHEEDLAALTPDRYRAVLLPNVAWLSDGECAQVAAFAAAGGSVMASFQTGLYDERGRARPQSGLAEVFGLQSAGPVKGPDGNGFYARLEREHPLLDGFKDTHWIPGGAYRVPVAAAGDPVLTVVPAYPAYPPEVSYAPVDRTGEPAAVIREAGSSRRVYFSGDVERAAWRSGQTDLFRLLQNAIRWVAAGDAPATVVGPGLVECFAWETEPGYAVHLLNYTNPNLHRGWLRRHYPIGEQQVRLALPAGRRVTRVELLRSGREAAFAADGGELRITVPQVVDYEVAAVIVDQT